MGKKEQGGEKRKPKAFPVGMRVRVHSRDKEGDVVDVPGFESRKVKIGKEVNEYPVSDLSEVVAS